MKLLLIQLEQKIGVLDMKAEIVITRKVLLPDDKWMYRKTAEPIDDLDPATLEIEIIWREPTLISPCVILTPRDPMTYAHERERQAFPIGTEFL